MSRLDLLEITFVDDDGANQVYSVEYENEPKEQVFSQIDKEVKKFLELMGETPYAMEVWLNYEKLVQNDKLDWVYKT